jgi:hypothetical protein
LPHAVETMFYVNELPWHGLGRKLEGNPTIPEAVEASGLGWAGSPPPSAPPPDFRLFACPGLPGGNNGA